MTLEAVAIGDIHGDKLTKYWPNANRMQMNSVRRVTEKAISRGIRHIFLLGDLAEGIRDSTGNSMRLSENGQCEFLSYFCEYDQKANIHVILGNHDFAQEGSHSLQVFIEMQRQNLFNTVRFYEKPDLVKIDGVYVNFLPYPHTEPTDRKAQMAVAHFEVSGATGDNGRRIKGDHEHRYGIPYVQGHLHTRQKVRNHYYPGTLYQTSFGENEDKGFMWFKTDGRKFKHEFIRNSPPFKLINLHIHKREDLKQLTTDPLILYKLFVAEDVRIPEDLLIKYPNIVNRLAFKNDEELEALEHNEFRAENNVIDLDSSIILPDYLKNKGATSKQVKRGLEIVEGVKRRSTA